MASAGMAHVSIAVSIFLLFMCFNGEAQEDFQFDYYKLAISWSRAMCARPRGCGGRTPNPSWTIQGYWPTVAINDKSSKGCDGKIITENEIANLRDELNSHWPSFSPIYKTNFEFWAYEWYQHGMCSNELAQVYFRKALTAFGRLNDTTHILAQQNIIPGNSYSGQQIMDAIQDHFGVQVQLRCSRNPDAGNPGAPDYELEEIYVCYETINDMTTDCPSLETNSCMGQVYYR